MDDRDFIITELVLDCLEEDELTEWLYTLVRKEYNRLSGKHYTRVTKHQFYNILSVDVQPNLRIYIIEN